MNSFLFNQWEWNNLVMYFVFSFFLIFFLYKKISGDSTPFTQKKEGVFQSTQKSLFWETLLWSLTYMAHMIWVTINLKCSSSYITSTQRNKLYWIIHGLRMYPTYSPYIAHLNKVFCCHKKKRKKRTTNL